MSVLFLFWCLVFLLGCWGAVVVAGPLRCVDHPNLPIVRILDGDTVAIHIPHSMPEPLGSELHLRLLGVDAPELHRFLCDAERVLALAATAAVQSLLLQQEPPTAVRLCGWNRTVLLPDGGRRPVCDKFGGRVLGDVLLADGTPLTSRMLDQGLVRPYHGTGGKPDWCAPSPPPGSSAPHHAPPAHAEL